eukprot:CAMPEP_0178968706 /NCGR_PEP_ID=MMETSP0789-20121207/18419_1 /TAXON_ID=3005 /ORGANISM="Rhizosolenia setigera, Strain CCMP 1694" /LENGTH=809 /DNA_ID=CAMNT_0020654697 /DNA_START=310 /DNA_END=2736 /DNA_ORIENTATION=-
MKKMRQEEGKIVQGNTKKKSRRTRKRVSNPKQTYVYGQKRRDKNGNPINTGQDLEVDEKEKTPAQILQEEMNAFYDNNDSISLAKSLGWNPNRLESVYCDPVEGGPEPKILAEILVGDHENEEVNSNTKLKAYIIEKPLGWSIFSPKGSKKKKKIDATKNVKPESSTPAIPPEEKEENLDIDMDAFLAMMTPEEIAEFESEGGSLKFSNEDAIAVQIVEESEGSEDERLTAYKVELAQWQALEKSGAVLNSPKPKTPATFAKDSKKDKKQSKKGSNATPLAEIEPYERPSVIKWLKDLKAAEGEPIKGGKYWVSLAGACDIDDSGLVLLCPKDMKSNIHVDSTRYTCVVGTTQNLSPPSLRKTQQKGNNIVPDDIKIVSKIQKGRGNDPVFTALVSFSDVFSTCSDLVNIIQKRFKDGIRGDRTADPIDVRAPRRLIHCNSISVSSLSQNDGASVSLLLEENDSYVTDDEDFEDDEEELFLNERKAPDDISLFTNRGYASSYEKGSFMGRSELRLNPSTNAYREVNGIADGYPGWIVDRYDKWVFIQHDENNLQGPLPSIHDGNTLGCYIFGSTRNRAEIGGVSKPELLEGKAAPDELVVTENGVKYIVSLSEQLSTGIFLDQRTQRAWLKNNCSDKTRILNCFAHCGAYSVAAACSGASTVSLDLDKKWLDRIEPQMRLNGIEDFNERHDCIYGDCFDWLLRLGKRGEKFDIVILDPPATSVGKKKKRWSVKKDMAELVTLAAPLVKQGGLLLTTNNCSTLHPSKFAKACKLGLDSCKNSKNSVLEKVVPMPCDFPSISTSPVTNLVW